MQNNMPARTREVFDYLRQCAREMRTADYGEIAQAVGLANQGVPRPLDHIRDVVCRPHGRPWLPAIAVSRGTQLPGDRFLPDGMVIPDRNDFRVWWRAMVLQVFAYNWDDVEL